MAFTRLAVVGVLAFACTALAADWPGYPGPHGGNGTPYEAPLVERWADAKLAWISDVPIPNGMAGEAPADKESHFGYFPRVMGSRVVCGGGDTDQLHLYVAGPIGFRRLDDARIPNAWGYEMPMMPALADGWVYLRTHNRLVCIDLRVGHTVTPLGQTEVMQKWRSRPTEFVPQRTGIER